MTLSIASLGIKVTTDGVQQAASDLDKLGKSSTTAASTVGKVAPQMERAALSAKQLLQQFTATSGSTGIVGDLIGLFRGGWGYADGGYTGNGGKYQPAGVVHKGEVVWSQSDVARAGGVGVVEAMRRGLRGYANGGPVGIRAPTAGGPSVEINIENKSGTRMEAQTSDLRFDGKKWVTSIVLEAIGSGQADSVAGQRWGVRPRGYANG
ncbi:phage tail tape measure protein [Pseudoxanthomonas sp. SGNA-20]|uniref:phage tail tape measure protein n=1 Tax=Pseudoxanthomonas sp. SGNA-20 TaxID=2493088 RepID=UPI000F644D5C|nr:phage tail tape measure protein [Pseudoxanthomonas sp. SGNA-20]RRN54977.1 phage tail tape measure protein [Pseudoxanthomonas sp. SGNA-20]